jgi:hypothetical protein
MIIVAPTALYLSLLPKDPDQGGSVTWTISSNDPPRAKISVPILTQTEELTPLPPKIFDPEQRQIGAGEFVFNVSFTNATPAGLGNKSFEAGQLLEFDDVDDVPTANRSQVPTVLDIQQNTNILDLEQFGIEESEIEDIEALARKRLYEVITELNDVKEQTNSVSVQILDNQKLINEVRKIHRSLQLILPADDPTLIKLSIKETELEQERIVLIDTLNQLHKLASEKYTLVIQLREVVR